MEQQEDLLLGVDDRAQAREGRKTDTSDDPRRNRSNRHDVPATEKSASASANSESALPAKVQRTRITLDQVQQIAEQLNAKALGLPVASPAKTKEEAIKILAPRIRDLRRRGCTLEEIASDLRESGLPIAVGTLRGYLPKKARKKAPNVAKPMKNQMGPSVQQFDVGDL